MNWPWRGSIPKQPPCSKNILTPTSIFTFDSDAWGFASLPEPKLHRIELAARQRPSARCMLTWFYSMLKRWKQVDGCAESWTVLLSRIVSSLSGFATLTLTINHELRANKDHGTW